jgi:hypothetical protein
VIHKLSYFFAALSVLIMSPGLQVLAEESGDISGPMIAATDKGSLDVELTVSPIPLEPEQETKLHIRFLRQGKDVVQEHIDYNIFVEKDGVEAFRIPLTHTNPGIVTIPYTFTSTGNFMIGVDVHGILFQPIPKETAKFSVTVVPEFPVGLALVMGFVTAVAVVLSRIGIFARTIYKK